MNSEDFVNVTSCHLNFAHQCEWPLSARRASLPFDCGTYYQSPPRMGPYPEASGFQSATGLFLSVIFDFPMTLPGLVAFRPGAANIGWRFSILEALESER